MSLRRLFGLTALLAVLPLHAQEGRVDASFAGRGWFQWEYYVGSNQALSQTLRDVAFTAEGRAFAIGDYSHPDVSGNMECGLIAIDAEGRHVEFLRELVIDRGGNNAANCQAIEPAADGGAWVVGEVSTAGDRNSAMLMKLTANGMIDTTFAATGVRVLNAEIPWLQPDEHTNLVDALIDTQGRLVAVGSVIGSTGQRGLIARFLADGSLDPAFGVGGAMPLADYNPPVVLLRSVVQDAQGRLLAAGKTFNNGLADATVIFRVNDDGQMDTTYGSGMNAQGRSGGGGRGFTGRCESIDTLLVDGSGRLLMGCEPDTQGFFPGTPLGAGVLRLDTNGQPDTTFGGDGLVELLGFSNAIGTIDGPPQIALQSDGRIVVSAALEVEDQRPGNLRDLYVVRLHASGNDDFTFGYAGGTSRLRLGDPQGTSSDIFWDRPMAMVLDARRRPLIVGQREWPGIGTEMLITRLGMADPNLVGGFLDPDFSYDGYRTERFEYVSPRTSVISRDLVEQADGRLAVLGVATQTTVPTQTSVCTVTRLLADAQAYDPTFATLGRRTLALDPNADNAGACRAMAAQSDGALYIAGAAANRGGTVIKLLPNGDVDGSFFGNGVLETWTDLGFGETNRRAFFNEVLVDPQDRIVLVGSIAQAGQTPDDRFGFVMRLTANGALDATFGDGGYVVLHNGTNPFFAVLSSAAMLPDGRLYVGGDEGINTQHGGVIYRLLANGQPDAGFSDDGYQSLRPTCTAITAIAVDPLQRPLFTCYTGATGVPKVMRLLVNGAADLNFGNGGVASINFQPVNPDSNGEPWDVVGVHPMSDGRLLVAGTHRNLDAAVVEARGSYDAAVTLLQTNGNPDAGFGVQGGANRFRLPDPWGRVDETPTRSAMRADGRVTILGGRYDARPGVPDVDRHDVFLFRIGNPLPTPPPPLLVDGFEGP